MRDHADVPRKQLRTSNYDADARIALGKAVEAARLAAGYKFRTEFCRAFNIKNLRGLELLEQGKTGVGQAFLYEVADALPGWDRETVRDILEGGDPPPPNPRRLSGDTEDGDASVFPSGWTDDEEQRWELASEMIPRLLGLDPQRYNLTRPRYRRMRAEIERLEDEERSREPGHAV